MIVGFRNKKTKLFAQGKFVRAFSGFEQQAERRLAILDAATSLDDLSNLNSNRFKALTGNKTGQFSIRINEQWRICFEWDERANDAFNVEIVDYH